MNKKAYNVNQGQPQTGACTPPTGCNSIAIVLDGIVESAPYIQTSGGIPGGVAQISGSFIEQSANNLAAVLNSGVLPTTFAVSQH